MLTGALLGQPISKQQTASLAPKVSLSRGSILDDLRGRLTRARTETNPVQRLALLAALRYRISLERGGAIAPFAITCGIYGWMMHTRFFAAEAQAGAAYDAMKADLAAIMEALPLKGEAEEAAKTSASMASIGAFVDKYP